MLFWFQLLPLDPGKRYTFIKLPHFGGWSYLNSHAGRLIEIPFSLKAIYGANSLADPLNGIQNRRRLSTALQSVRSDRRHCFCSHLHRARAYCRRHGVDIVKAYSHAKIVTILCWIQESRTFLQSQQKFESS
jgi:hypothetical protein